MDAKLFLRNKSIFNENYIYNLDDEAFELSNLLTEYAQALQLQQTDVSISLVRAKKYARHQHFLGTQGKELVEFEDWKQD